MDWCRHLCYYWLMCRSVRDWRVVCFFFQAEDGIRDLVRSRGLGDVYKRQVRIFSVSEEVHLDCRLAQDVVDLLGLLASGQTDLCLLYTSDAADERSSVDLGGRRIIKKKIIVTTRR